MRAQPTGPTGHTHSITPYGNTKRQKIDVTATRVAQRALEDSTRTSIAVPREHTFSKEAGSKRPPKIFTKTVHN